MIRGFVALACFAILAAACSDSSVTVDVFAASSLTDAFTELEERFEADNPGVDIRLNLAGSDTLRRQIDDGADADVFAPAAIVMFEGLEAVPTPYAANQLQIITIDDASVTHRVMDGDFDGLLVARCAAGVPCGAAADELIEALSLDLSDATVTAEANVRAVSAKVALGEADVGFVYRTDAAAAGDAVISTAITSPEATVILAIARLDAESDEAQLFIDFVLNQQDLFSSLGFDRTP